MSTAGNFGFLSISKVYVPKQFIHSVYEEFRKTGDEGYECLALFAGKKEKTNFMVSNLIFPRQYLKKGLAGLSFFVDETELDRINDWLYDNQCMLIAQLHSHPHEAYHSEADNDLALITTLGGLSIVVPDFGYADQHFNESAFFRLLPEKGWTALTKLESSQLLKIID